MKKKIGELKGCPIIIASNKNEVLHNEILYKENNGIISLSKWTKNGFKEITNKFGKLVLEDIPEIEMSIDEDESEE